MSTEQPMQEPTKKALSETVKEVGRYLVSLGLVDVLIVGFQMIQSGINTSTGAISINWGLIGAVSLFGAFTAIIRGLDKFKHEYSKETDPEVGRPQGILPF